MNGVVKVFVRSVVGTAGSALLLLCVNVLVFFLCLLSLMDYAHLGHGYEEIASGLTREAAGYSLSADAAQTANASGYIWMMLLNHEGDVIWNQDMPKTLPTHYTVDDVARFTRWYLDDYPVDVWVHPDGLLVLAGARNSVWKHGVKFHTNVLAGFLTWGIAAIFLNIAVALLLACLANMRQYRSIKLLAGGIARLQEAEPVQLAAGGTMGELKESINRVSERLAAQRAALQKRDTARTNWISGVSHDIRTPLSMILGYASEIEENVALPEETRRQSGIIRAQSLKIKKLIADLNLASKLEYEMQPLKMECIRLGELARQLAVDFLNGGLDERYRITLNVTECTMRGDAALIRRAVENLLQNSIDHNPDGTAITLAAVYDRENESVIIEVADDGIGVDRAVLEALQARRYTLSDSDAATSRRGMGLLIVGQIAKAHGGRLDLGPNGKKGFSASIVLPCGREC